jgi:cation:H+ antiporter
MLLESVAIFVVALLFLFKSSEVVVENSIKIARILRISRFAVGFILVALATSLPELFVSVISALENNTGIAVGNVIGSNIANIALVLGLTSFFGVLSVKKEWLTENIFFLFAISLIPLMLLNQGTVGLFGGLILVGFFIFYVANLMRERAGFEPWQNAGLRHKLKVYLYFFAAIAVLIISAKFVVDSAVTIASILAVPPGYIGLTIIAIGTSLPELSVTIMAARKKYATLALGHIIGSCIANLTLVLGAAAIINPLVVDLTLFNSASIFLVGLSMFLYPVNYPKWHCVKEALEGWEIDNRYLQCKR